VKPTPAELDGFVALAAELLDWSHGRARFLETGELPGSIIAGHNSKLVWFSRSKLYTESGAEVSWREIRRLLSGDAQLQLVIA
jgi:hypothetical protein